MNLTLKSVSAAVLLALGSASAYAASNDGLPTRGAGTGEGDLMFAYEAPGGQASIVWDLAIFSGTDVVDDLTWTSILTGPNKNGFSISFAPVVDFVTANPGGRWNIFALTNTRQGTGTGANLQYQNGGYGLTINGDPDVNAPTGNTGGKIESLMVNNAAWINAANIGGLADNGALLAGPADAWQFNAGGTHSNIIAAQNATGLVGETLGYWTILIDNTVTRGLNANNTNFAQGRAPTFSAVTNSAGVPMAFTFAADGTLNYAPVPVPAAVWMMGSAIAGLGVLRRRKA